VSPIYSALVHFPVRARDGAPMTSAITNLDIHDIARSSRTFGLSGFYVVTPIAAQRALVDRVLEHWGEGGDGRRRTPERGRALEICHGAQSVEEVVALIAARHGVAPRILATAARSLGGVPAVTFETERVTIGGDHVPRLILFGTAHGLTDDLVAKCDGLLPPILGAGDYNHLSVRAAAAIVFDRLLGAQRPEN